MTMKMILSASWRRLPECLKTEVDIFTPSVCCCTDSICLYALCMITVLTLHMVNECLWLLCMFWCWSEPTVRAELMEQVPNIAMFLHESRPNFPAAFSRYLVPIVVRYLTDPNNQVHFKKDYTNKKETTSFMGADSLLCAVSSRCGRPARQHCWSSWNRACFLKLIWRPKFVQFCWN